MDTGKSLRKTGISPSGEIPSCPHNALLEILSRNHARVQILACEIENQIGRELQREEKRRMGKA